ncbi:MAG: hypothetical protein J6P46_00370 [Bacteroidales bacterium]|nr:hypothetical protein [Bacteroidales bacterium]
MIERSYRVGDHVFTVALEEPWKFMNYTAPVAERIERAAAGEELPIVPTRAGDEVPARTFVQGKAELPAEMDRNTLDFSQYEPFRTALSGQAPLFRLTVRAEEPAWIAAGKADGSVRKIMSVDERPPFYYIYEHEGATLYEFDAAQGKIAGTLWVSAGHDEAEYFPKPGFGPYTTMFQLSTALMILYTYNAAVHDTLLMHASVVRHEGLANLFLRVSGTGKSTHSRLWLSAIPGCDLVNDDNPVLRIVDGRLYVYGTPWSGKTPCYRNLRIPVRALVRLDQAPRNEIKPLTGLSAYASILPAASGIRWNRTIMDAITATVEKVVTHTPCYHLDCLPDPAAARTCLTGIE